MSRSTPLFSFKNLYCAYKSCINGKINKISAWKFEKSLLSNLVSMSRELSNRTYQSGPFTCFAIVDPKLREVWAADFKDRIIHHLLISRIEHIWEREFIFDSYACRKEKGAHRAVNKLKKIIKNKQEVKYLHLDVRGFFTNIDRDILYRIISKKIHNPDLLYLANLIVFNDPKSNYIIKGNEKLLRDIPRHKSLFGVEEGKGLPIGNYTSQFFANVYLNELDQYAKRTLKKVNYFRYMDDIIIIEKDSRLLRKAVRDIDEFLHKHLKLSLHPKKTIIQDVEKGINALGYIIYPEYTLSRKRIVGNIRRRLNEFNKLIKSAKNKGEQDKIVEKAMQVINSYWAHFRHANCASLRKSLVNKHFGLLIGYLEYDPDQTHFIMKKDRYK